MKKIAVLLTALAVQMGFGGASASILHVPDDYATIQGAIDAASDGDEVRVSEGEYVENVNFSRKNIFLIGSPESPQGVTIRGNGDAPVVVFAAAEQSECRLSGFTLTGGSGRSIDNFRYGGGIYISGANPTISDCILLDNDANYGGGVFCQSGAPVISRCEIRGNNAPGETSFGGGACFVQANPVLESCTFADNSADNIGGGLFAIESRVMLDRCRILRNTAISGGGMKVTTSSEIHIENGEISDNTAANGGGVYCDDNTAITALYSVIARNYVSGIGGGVYCRVNSETTLQSCTLTDNTADEWGDGILLFQNATVSLLNTILWNNERQIEATAFNYRNTINIEYSCIEGAQNSIFANDNADLNWGDGNIDADPRFADPDNGDYRLTDGSPCIDAGDPNSPHDPDGTQADMGALYFAHERHILHVPDDYETIQAGIDAASDGDTVLAASGTYYENINFNGKSISVIGDQDRPENVVIDGGGNGSVVEIVGGEVILEGFTIRGGRNDVGGGLLCRSRANACLRNLIITENACMSSPFYGAGIYAIDGSIITAEECIISQNSGSDLGGGLFCVSSSLSFVNCDFSSNSARYGAGAYIVGSNCLFTGSSLSNNEASQYGGASIVTISENRESSEVNFHNVSIIDNYAAQDFGGILVESGNTVNFSRTTIVNNGNIGIGVSGNSDVNIVNTIVWQHLASFYSIGRVTVSYSDIEFSGDTLEGNGNLSSDPRFLDPDNGDFRLHRGSPCINTGDPDSPPDPDGTRADMGAFPYNYQGPITLNVPDEYATIQAGIDDAISGDEVLVAAGTYAPVSIDGKSISIIGDPANPENVVIDGNGGGAVVSFVGARTDGARLEGFSIQNASGVAWGEGALWGEEAGSITLSHLLVTNIEEYVFHSSNTVFNVDHATIHTVSQNGVFNATGVNLTNSIVRGFSGQVIRGGNVSATYSDIQGGYEGEGNIDADPRFLDPDNGNFRLHRGSQCVNTGDPDSPPDPDGTRADMGAYPFDHTASHQIFVPEDFATIQPAIDDALDGDTILVAAGTYAENLDIDDKSISIIGDPENPGSVVIDGGNAGSVIFAKYVYGEPVVLDGLTLRNGNGTAWHCTHGDNHFYSLGGGLLLDDVALVARNLDIRNCTAMEGGGVTSVGTTDITFTNVNFDSTSGWSGGSAVVAYTAMNLVWNGGSITNDLCFDTDGEGGYKPYGMFFVVGYESDLQINNVVAVGNRGAADAAIYLENGAAASLDHVTWVNNDWPALVGNIERGIFSARNSIFRNNNGNNYAGEINYCDAEGIEGGEGNIDADPIFADPDNGDFTLTRFSPCVDAGDPNAELDPDGTVADMGAFTLHQTFHRIPLHSGWSIISTFNQPRDASVRSVWGAIVERGNLTLTKDQSGRFYNPAIGADGFSNMQPWDVRQGYMARLMRTDTLVTLNVPVEVNTPIPLRQGWNICAYFPEEDLTAPEAFVNLGEDLVMAKDELGRFCRPSIMFSNMGRLTRGKGYQINVARDVELVYPNGEQMAGRTGLRTRPPADDLYSTGTEPRPTDSVLPVHFLHTEMTGANMSVLIADYGLRIGELGEISAFTKEGLCVGAASFRNLESEIRIGLAVWGDDPTTPEIDGAVEGEALDFRLWDGQAETPILLKWTEGAGVYQSDGFAMGEIGQAGTPILLPTTVKLYEAYPNPFNSVTSVRFDLPQAGKVMLNVRNIAGREVAKLAEGNFAAGSHVVAWQAEGVPTGVYLVRLVTAGSTFTTRAVIVK